MNCEEVKETFWFCDLFKFWRQCIYSNKLKGMKSSKVKVWKRGVICQWKVYDQELKVDSPTFKAFLSPPPLPPSNQKGCKVRI